MPIYNSKDLIPFVNILEQRIAEAMASITTWDANKNKIINALPRLDSTYTTALSALVRADEAMSEIGTATFTSAAQRGKRLEDTLNNLKEEVYEIAANAVGSGGGGELTEGVFYEELNNAIASVDATIEDGLKLDYRLRELQDLATTGGSLSDKRVYMPYKYQLDTPVPAFSVPQADGIVFVDGEVTVLNLEGMPMTGANGRIITATIDATGQVRFSVTPEQSVLLYFPVDMSFGDIPQDFLYLFMQQVLQKNSSMLEVTLGLREQLDEIFADIEAMKGVNWTPDFSIMRNYQDIVKEGITPKGLNVEIVDGKANVMFSYNDHPHLSHFVLERLDPETNNFVPYDGESGIVQK